MCKYICISFFILIFSSCSEQIDSSNTISEKDNIININEGKTRLEIIQKIKQTVNNRLNHPLEAVYKSDSVFVTQLSKIDSLHYEFNSSVVSKNGFGVKGAIKFNGAVYSSDGNWKIKEIKLED